MFPTPYGLSANQGQGDGEFGKAIRNSVKYPTPKASDSERGGRGELLALVRGKKTRQIWPTPTASLCFRYGHNQGSAKEKKFISEPGQLNPTWVEWLMGFPTGFSDCEDSETPSCPKSQNGSDDE
jgi:hypothetical protein